MCIRDRFSFIGNQMNKKLMEKAGGGPGSMMFGGVGKSNAKVYVQSTHGIDVYKRQALMLTIC